jgi:hypothetical protein
MDGLSKNVFAAIPAVKTFHAIETGVSACAFSRVLRSKWVIRNVFNIPDLRADQMTTAYTPMARSEVDACTWKLLSRKRLRIGAFGSCMADCGRRRNVGIAIERISMWTKAATVAMETS